MSAPKTNVASRLKAARDRLASVHRVVPHTDADGLAAGAIALRARGESAAAAVILKRGQTPFGPKPPLDEVSVAVIDWGMRELCRPGLIIDHHVPETEPNSDQILISGHGEKPETSTAPLLRRMCPEAPAWLAAVGAVGDLGDAAWLLPECSGTPKAAVRRLVPLVNAARRVPDGPVGLALELLCVHETPSALMADERVQVLEEARDWWRGEYARAIRTAPRVAGEVALIRFSSPCQIHPLIATAWARRLKPRAVIAANDGYLVGRVNFSIRGGRGDLRKLLLNALSDVDGEFGHGHPRATGGSISPGDFDRLQHSFGLET